MRIRTLTPKLRPSGVRISLLGVWTHSPYIKIFRSYPDWIKIQAAVKRTLMSSSSLGHDLTQAECQSVAKTRSHLTPTGNSSSKTHHPDDMLPLPVQTQIWSLQLPTSVVLPHSIALSCPTPARSSSWVQESLWQLISLGTSHSLRLGAYPQVGRRLWSARRLERRLACTPSRRLAMDCTSPLVGMGHLSTMARMKRRVLGLNFRTLDIVGIVLSWWLL